MASTKTKITVGLFVLIGLLIAIVSIIWLGMSHYFEEGKLFVAYFDESVQGLDKDSPVKYRGVSIGRVESIRVAPDAILIEVILKIESRLKADEDRENQIEDVVAQLKSVGITGIMFIEIDRKKAGEPELSPRITFPTKYPVIATKPSEIKKIIKGVDEVIQQINKLDFAEISNKLKSTLDRVNQAVGTGKLEAISSDIRLVLKQTQNILGDVENKKIIDLFANAGTSAHALLKNSNHTISLLNKRIETLERIFADTDVFIKKGTNLITNTDDMLFTLSNHLIYTIQSLEKNAQNLNRLIELLADQPSQILFGKPPPPRTIEPIDEVDVPLNQ
ncbi:MAG: MCE family protein [Desulfobacterales bacterium]|nr:MCE family protein [Desulfobacterales bacterium]